MRTLFFGTSEFAIPSLQVVAERTQLAGVVTQPDRPGGRGQKMRPTPVKSKAQELGIRVYEPHSLREFAATIAAEEFDLFVLASYGKILPKELLELPKRGALNVHPSLLPKYRGATPIQSAIRNGEIETGVTIMLMDTGMDTGDIVLQERTPIVPDETYGELHDRLANMGARLLAQVLDLASRGEIPRALQRGESSVTRPLSKADLQIDWQKPAAEIVNLVRALSPQPAARATIFDMPVKIVKARVASDGGLVVKSGDGAVEILEVIAPNRPSQSGAELAASLKR